jgi:hypothetical protein
MIVIKEMENNFESSWMSVQTLDEEKLNSAFVLDLYETFFEDMTEHHFTEQRLSWLYHWFGNEEKDKHDKLTFMMHIWKMRYFNPFATPEQTAEIIANEMDENRFHHYTISLSSTKPEMLRITFYSKLLNGIVHRRIHVGDLCNQIITDHFNFDEPVKFNLIVLETQIGKLLKHHHHQGKHRPVPYVSTWNFPITMPVPYKSVDDI